MRCTYCYAPPQAGAAMTEATAFAALELGARLNAASGGSCGVIFFGGEPLLHKDRIAVTIERARQMERRQAGRFHFKVTTNGTLLDAAFIEFANRHDLLIAMSFDGVALAHDRHRRLADGSSSFDLLVDRLQLLLAARPYASVLTVVTPETVGWLAESVEFLLDLGVRYLIISLNYAGAWREEHYRELKRQYIRLGRRYVKWTLAERKFYLSPFEVKLSSHINRHNYRKERCELAQRQISVAPTGHLFPCVQFVSAGPASDWCIGHVTTGIDETARARLYAMSQAEKETCRQCAIKERCNNTCGCLNWQTTGAVTGVSPVLCRHEQTLMPIADRVGAILYRKRNALFLHKHYNAAYPVLSLLEDVPVAR